MSRARDLRRSMTKPEVALWQELRQRPGGLKFRCQHPIGPYVVDVCCLLPRLVVEVDGIAHDMGNNPARDEERDRFIKENGFRVLRVSASRVLTDAAAAASAIVAWAENPLHRPVDGGPPRTGEDR
ncbi:endonuclease domain-containing protein [Novosphingobium clariflavum]|uniref:Endonuclease domain-containing protein n=1 Tax=Novosphingobium clariflavum TaxID=2029884 RepID=A0ABV6S9V8_9SPHN|nr:DUF559 domain-containing protein [Novosphingobium clariflavum]